MGTDKDMADKAKADVERVEAEEDDGCADSGQRPAKPHQVDDIRTLGFGTDGRQI